MDNKRERDAMSEFMQANIAQCKALQLLNPEQDQELEIKMIFLFGHEWRVIINEFLEREGKVPTEEDIIWCSSLDEHLGKDIRIIVQELKQL